MCVCGRLTMRYPPTLYLQLPVITVHRLWLRVISPVLLLRAPLPRVHAQGPGHRHEDAHCKGNQPGRGALRIVCCA